MKKSDACSQFDKIEKTKARPSKTAHEYMREATLVVAEKILQFPQVVAMVLVDHALKASKQTTCELYQVCGVSGEKNTDVNGSKAFDVDHQTMSSESSLLAFCLSQVEDEAFLGLAANKALIRNVDAVHRCTEIQASELVSQIAIFPYGYPCSKRYHLIVMLSGTLSPIFIRSIRLLVKTSHVIHDIQQQDSQRHFLKAKKRYRLSPPDLLSSEGGDLLKSVVDGALNAVALCDVEGKIIFSNSQFCHVFGFLSVDDTVQRDITHVVHCKTRHEDNQKHRIEGHSVNGKSLVLNIHIQPITMYGMTFKLFFIEDCTQLNWEEGHKKVFQHELSSIFDLALVGIFEVNTSEECIFSNAYLDKLLGHSLVGGSAQSWLQIFEAEDQQEIQAHLQIELQKNGIYSRYCQIQAKSSERLWIRFHACRNQAAEGGFVGTVTDETAQRMQEIRLRELAEVDQLTGLVNRHAMHDRLKNSLEYIERYGAFVVMCLDLDGFKNINDSLGHDVGDALLVEVSKRLRKTTRKIDVIVRMGGDEFVVLLANGIDETAASRVAHEIINEIRKPIHYANRSLYITVSIGIVVCDDPMVSSGTLLKQGDMALYQAKASGRNNFQFFTPELDQAARSKLEVITQLHEALSNQQFFVQYQPQLSMENYDIFGFEALLRWSPSKDVEVSPSKFIGLLEDTGLIHDVSNWMLETCFADFSRWRKAGWVSSEQKLSVNISSSQLLLKGFVDRIERLCRTHDLEPNDIILELNETSFMDRVLKGESVVQEIKARQFALAIDDFGTGYSSILALIQLKVDYLKINTSLMRDIFADPKDLAVVDSIIAIGSRLGIKVIAVGVDHPAKINYLKDLGCQICQGFAYSRPMSAAFLEYELFKSDKRDNVRGLKISPRFCGD